MPETAEQIAKEGRDELAQVLDLLNLRHVITIEKSEPVKAVEHWYLDYRIWVNGLRHTNKVLVSGSQHTHVYDVREGLFKRLLGDLGRGLLGFVREERNGS